jgi:hypothetical protein
MLNEPVLLTALIAPGSVESVVGKVQAALLAEHGLASAQALPPLIPIAFLDAARVQRELLVQINASIRPGWRIRITEAIWCEGHLYAGVESGGVWRSLRDRALEICGAEKGCLFPAVEGFYLGCSDAAPGQRSLIRPAVPAVSFSSGAITLLTIRAAVEWEEWWREVRWEVLDLRPLRGRKTQ